MALFPETFETKMRMAPGGNGEYFVADAPGYRAGELRINRTNNRLNITPHEALSQKYLLDTRLKPLFRYGWAIGYNYMVVTKGRVVAADPYRNAVDWTSDKMFNTLTLANGGVPVKVRSDADTYPSTGAAVSAGALGHKAALTGLEWAPVMGLDKAYADTYFRGLEKTASAQMTDAKLGIDKTTGNILENVTVEQDGTVSGGAVTKAVRPANKPLGMIQRNEYTRFDNDSMDGMQPGPILTDAIVELPYFAFKDKAEGNPWGSVYGQLHVGDLIKSDENGRMTVSPLAIDTLVEKMTAAEIERERQQVIGQVIGVSHDLVPEGGYKWATWALEDRLKYEGFAPDLWTQNNRPGEDNINSSAYQSSGRYPGYPYDKAYTEHDLHMLASNGRKDNFNKFMSPEHQYENLGIPGLTDGANVAVRHLENNKAAVIRKRADATQEFIKQHIRIDYNGNVVDGSVSVQLTNGTDNAAFVPVNTKDALPIKLDAAGAFQIEYFNAIQGMLVISVANEAEADKALAAGPLNVNIKYDKKGMAGVPTFMDWDGCVGSAKILLQR